MKKIERASRNGHGNSCIAEQMSIIGGKNNARKEAYVKSHTILVAVLPELFRSNNLKCAALYLARFDVIPHEVAQAAYKAGRSGLLTREAEAEARAAAKVAKIEARAAQIEAKAA